MNPSVSHLSCNPEPWQNVVLMLETQVSELPMTDWRPVIDDIPAHHPDRSGHIRRELLRIYGEHCEKVLRAAIHRLESGQWPELKGPEIYYLRQMHGKALCFLQGIVLTPNGRPETIFQFPGKNLAEVVLWFLSDWWMENGLQEILFEAGRREEPPPYTFSNN
jgi:hypothetical protein